MNTTDKMCKNCFFGTPTENGKMCECHANRPVSSGKFPVVRTCDYCGYWTDEKTLCRPFVYLPADPWSGLPQQGERKAGVTKKGGLKNAK